MKYFTSSLELIASNRNLRLDYRFLEYAENKLPFTSTPFRKFITNINNGKDVSKENYVGFNKSDIIYPTVNNFKNSELILDAVTFINDNWLDENSRTLSSNDVIISRSGTIGITYVWNETYINKKFCRDIIAIPSGYLIVVKVDKSKLLPEFVKHYFSTELMKKYFGVFGVGKSQKNIAQPEILTIPIPNLSIGKQNQIIEKISPIDKQVQKLKDQIKPDTEIINEVFAKEFNLNLNEISSAKQEFIYILKFSQLNASKDFRSAVKFNSNKYDFLKLPIFHQYKIGEFANYMTLGRQITPEDFEEENDYYYLLPNCIKKFYLEEDLLRPISDNFYNTYKHIALKRNDIVLAASGEGTIGKSAIFNSDKDCVLSQFTMKIELNNKIDLNYFHYYLQSIFFQLTVEKFKKGMGNMTNIFVSQVTKFPILFNPTNQEEIVNVIKTATGKQRIFDKKILEKKEEINRIIQEAIK